MALGDTYNNNKNDKNKFSPSVYSPYKMGNADSVVDPSVLYATFWNNMLKLSIAPRKQTSNASDVAYDYDNAISVYLTHTKANMLFQEIAEYEKNPDLYNYSGVSSGQGLISISNGREFGVNSPCIVIRKINPETGAEDSSYVYQFKQDYHYSIRNYDPKTNEFDKIFYNKLEIEELKILLQQ
jgi:hypothetical protein